MPKKYNVDFDGGQLIIIDGTDWYDVKDFDCPKEKCYWYSKYYCMCHINFCIRDPKHEDLYKPLEVNK